MAKRGGVFPGTIDEFQQAKRELDRRSLFSGGIGDQWKGNNRLSFLETRIQAQPLALASAPFLPSITRIYIPTPQNYQDVRYQHHRLIAITSSPDTTAASSFSTTRTTLHRLDAILKLFRGRRRRTDHRFARDRVRCGRRRRKSSTRLCQLRPTEIRLRRSRSGRRESWWCRFGTSRFFVDAFRLNCCYHSCDSRPSKRQCAAAAQHVGKPVRAVVVVAKKYTDDARLEQQLRRRQRRIRMGISIPKRPHRIRS